MRRRYTTAKFDERITAVRQRMPEAFIGIDVIVGFPGETDSDFRTTYDFLAKLQPAYLHVFPFSERPGTPAVNFEGKVPPATSAERVKQLSNLCTTLQRTFYERAIGCEASVLFESTYHAGMMSGFTENYIRVCAPYDRKRVNSICRVMLDSIGKNGEIIGIILD